MSFKNKYINIVDWAGNVLLNAEYDDPKVDEVLNMNRCALCDSGAVFNSENLEDLGDCTKCDGSGYSGDFEIYWEDESDKNGCNVYEYVNY